MIRYNLHNLPKGWRAVALGDIARFLDERRIPIKAADRSQMGGPYPYYGASGIIDYVNDYLFDGEFILLGEDGANILTRSSPLAFQVKGKIWVNNHAHVILPGPEVDAGYLTEFLESISYTEYNTGTAQPKLPQATCLKINIVLPPLPEQRKIAQILGTWDAAIGRVEQLIAALQRRKQGLMQRLLTGEVRFAEFDEPWSEVTLGQFLHYRPRKLAKPSGSYIRMGVRSHGKGTFTEIIDDPASVAMDYLYEVKGDDLIVNITFAWERAIAIVDGKDAGALVSHRFPTYEFDRNVVVPEFFRYLMLTERFHDKLELITPGGAGRNRVMNKTDFLKLIVKVPSFASRSVLALCSKPMILLFKRISGIWSACAGRSRASCSGC